MRDAQCLPFLHLNSQVVRLIRFLETDMLFFFFFNVVYTLRRLIRFLEIDMLLFLT